MSILTKYLAIAVLSIFSIAYGQNDKGEKIQIGIRGQEVNIFRIAAVVGPPHQNFKIILAPGDGGWRGFAVTMANSIASWGYDVYGLDTKDYLSEFTGKTVLKESEIMADFNQISRVVDSSGTQNVILVGWSEGAGLCLLGAALDDNKKLIKGLVTIGLPDSNVLGWRFADNLTYLTKKDPNEKMFGSASYLPQVTPLPIYMIQSTGDEYVTEKSARQMFDLAKEPKKFALVSGKNHKFEGNDAEFFRILHQGIEWIKTTPQ